MRRIFERLFLLIFTIVVGSIGLTSLASLLRFQGTPLWFLLLSGGLVLLMIVGFAFKIRAARFRSATQEKAQTETIFK